MNARQNHIAYFEDLAKRLVAIGHDPAAASTRRFFMEADSDIMVGGAFPNNTGWNLILMPFQSRGTQQGYTHTDPMVAYRVVKHAKQQNEAGINTIINGAWDVAWELWLQMNEHSVQCMQGEAIARLSAGVEHFRWIDQASLRTYEIGPVYDNFYGYEFSFNYRLDKPLNTTTTPASWQDL